MSSFCWRAWWWDICSRAWEYPRLAAWYMQYVTSQWAADIAGFFTIFFAAVLLAGLVGRCSALGGAGHRAVLV